MASKQGNYSGATRRKDELLLRRQSLIKDLNNNVDGIKARL